MSESTDHLLKRELDELRREIDALKAEFSKQRTIDGVTFMFMHIISYAGLIFILLNGVRKVSALCLSRHCLQQIPNYLQLE